MWISVVLTVLVCSLKMRVGEKYKKRNQQKEDEREKDSIRFRQSCFQNIVLKARVLTTINKTCVKKTQNRPRILIITLL